MMGDIIDEKSGRTSMTTFNALQTVKYALKSSGKSALEYFRRENIKRTPVDKQLISNMQGSWAAYEKFLEEEKSKKDLHFAACVKDRARVLSKRKAIEVLREDAKRKKIGHYKMQAVLVAKSKIKSRLGKKVESRM